jgi:hypothetical protein
MPEKDYPSAAMMGHGPGRKPLPAGEGTELANKRASRRSHRNYRWGQGPQGHGPHPGGSQSHRPRDCLRADLRGRAQIGWGLRCPGRC